MQSHLTTAFLKKIYHIGWVNKIVEPSKKIVFPGFDGIPLFYVLKFFVISLFDGSIPTRAAAMAFSFFLAFFPTIIFIFTLIPYIPIDGFQIELINLLSGLMPKTGFEAVKETLEDLILIQRGGLLSFGFIGALLFATNGVHSMIDAFNSNYINLVNRTYLQQRFIATVLTFIILLLVIAAIALIILSEFLLPYLPIKDSFSIFLINLGKWIILVILFFLSLSFIFYLGPSKDLKWKFISAGSTLATFLSVCTSLGFSTYVNHFGQYNKLYGSLGTLIVVLLWIYFNCYILLLGFELNASIRKANHDFSKIQPKEDL